MNLIITDLDGTLFNSNGEISTETKRYLIKRKEAGDKLIIASGRSLYSASKWLLEFKNYVDYFILQNGSIIYNDKEEIIYENKLAKSKLEELYELTKDIRGLDLVYFDGEKILSLIDPSVSQEIMADKEIPKVKIDIKDVKEDVYKCLFLGKSEVLMKAKERISKVNVTSCLSCPTFLEVNNLGVSKGSAVKKVINSLEDVHHVFIFGDNDNDISMLLLDNYETIAMKNGSEIAKSVAKYVTKYDHDNDGIMHFLSEEFTSLEEANCLDHLKNDMVIKFDEE